MRERMPATTTLLRFLPAGLLLLFALLTATSAPVSAQRNSTPAPVPMAGAWCGVTDDGGKINVTVSDDMRFIMEVTIETTRAGSFTSSESGCAADKAQVADGKFIFRCRESSSNTTAPGSSNRCTRAPCRPSSGGTGTRTSPSNIRGSILGPETMKGNYSAYATRVLQSVNGDRTSTKLVVGNFIAWPVSTAPCP
jgi:hypothetical protein